MSKKSKICRLCNASYVEDSKCSMGYCRECSRLHKRQEKKRVQSNSQLTPKHTFTHRKSKKKLNQYILTNHYEKGGLNKD